jgi:hypothetical protein
MAQSHLNLALLVFAFLALGNSEFLADSSALSTPDDLEECLDQLIRISNSLENCHFYS